MLTFKGRDNKLNLDITVFFLSGGSFMSKNHESEALIETLSRSKAVWESTFDVISDPVLVINNRYEIKRANKSFAETSGVSIKDIVGKTCYRVFADRDAPCMGCPVAQTRADSQSHRSEIEPLHKTKRQYVVSAYSLPSNVKTDDEDIVLHYRDVSDEKQLQARLVHNEKMAAVGTLAGGVAHEINNPLGGILAFAQLAMRQVAPDHPCYQDLQEIESAAMRCKQIVRNLLDFSRHEATPRKGLIDLNSVIQKSLPIIKLSAKQIEAQIHENYESHLPLIEGDFNQLQQVVINLATNSCHALKDKGGELWLKTSYDKKRQVVVMEFKDNGCGIPEDIVGRIFDPYFTTKDQGEGTGLGLSITYKIIQEHQGWIEVQSKPLVGTTFLIYLPVDSSQSVKDKI